MRIGFLLEGEGDELIKAFRRLGEDVSIRILASRECYIDKERVEIIETFKKAGLKNLEVIKVDAEKNYMLVKGNVPGPKKGLVMVKTTTKKVKHVEPKVLLSTEA